MGSYFAVAFDGSVLILLALGLASGLEWSIVAGEFSHFPRVIGMSLSKIPSVWTIIGISALLYGWLPRIGSILNWLTGRVDLYRDVLGGWNRRMVRNAMDALRLCPLHYPSP